jgi:hypothetical protein
VFLCWETTRLGDETIQRLVLRTQKPEIPAVESLDISANPSSSADSLSESRALGLLTADDVLGEESPPSISEADLPVLDAKIPQVTTQYEVVLDLQAMSIENQPRGR